MRQQPSWVHDSAPCSRSWNGRKVQRRGREAELQGLRLQGSIAHFSRLQRFHSDLEASQWISKHNLPEHLVREGWRVISTYWPPIIDADPNLVSGVAAVTRPSANEFDEILGS